MSRSRVHSIFVNNLPWTIGNQELKKYFSEFGRVKWQTVMFSRVTGFSRGYGFVKFDSQEAVDNVFSKQKHVLEGSILQIQERDEPEFDREKGSDFI